MKDVLPTNHGPNSRNPAPPGTQPAVAISILNWNGWRDTLECLESVRKLDYPNYLTVVVDNGSTNGSADKIKAWAEQNLGPDAAVVEYHREAALRGGMPACEQELDRTPPRNRMAVIRNSENLGFATGHNVAIRYAMARGSVPGFVFLLNNDATVAPDCLRELVAACEQPNAGLIGARIFERDSGRLLFGGRAPLRRQFFSPLLSWQLPPPEGFDVWESEFIHGAAMMICRDLLEGLRTATGTYLDDKLFLYGEEHAISFQAYRLGYKGVVARRAAVYHRRRQEDGRSLKPLSYYYASRNRVHLAGLTLPLALRAVFHPYNLLLTLASASKKVLSGRREMAHASIIGTWDGYRGVTGKWGGHDKTSAAG